MNLIQLSWKNLTNKPLSMLLSLVLFALGVGLISLLLLINQQVQDKFNKNLAGINLVIGAKGSPLQLILSSMYHIDYPTGNISIREARPFMNPNHPLIKKAIPLSLGDSYNGYRIVGTEQDYLELYAAEIAQGKLWEADYEVTIGAGVAQEQHLGLGDKFQSSHGLVQDDNLIHEDAHAFKVVGIMQPTGSVIDQLILTSPQSIWGVHDAHEMDVDQQEENHSEHDQDHPAERKALIDEIDQEITALLVQYKARNIQTLSFPRNINENTDMLAADPAIELNRLYGLMDVGEQTMRSMAYVIIFVSALSIFISLFSSLKDRKYELALMRVMGASRSQLFLLIILEGLILAFLGYMLGVVLSHVGMEVLAGVMQNAYRYSFTGLTFLSDEIKLLGGALAIGMIAAILPAIQAYNTQISRTLATN